jgi:hypothetical protein
MPMAHPKFQPFPLPPMVFFTTHFSAPQQPQKGFGAQFVGDDGVEQGTAYSLRVVNRQNGSGFVFARSE